MIRPDDVSTRWIASTAVPEPAATDLLAAEGVDDPAERGDGRIAHGDGQCPDVAEGRAVGRCEDLGVGPCPVVPADDVGDAADRGRRSV